MANGPEQVAGTSSGNNSSGLSLAVITDSFAHAGVYSIRLPNGPIIPAVDAMSVSGLPLGARPIGQHMPRTRVLIYHDSNLQYAVILGAVPRGAASSKFMLPNSMVMRSNVGIVEERHYLPFKVTNTLFTNNSVGRPSDSLPGDWGAINDLGVAVFIGRMLASLKASDMAKIEAFWGDDLLRLTGYNLETFTASRHDYAYNDEGEYNEVDRLSPYPWEGMGVGSPTAGSALTKTDGKLKPGGEDAPLEPKFSDQLIIPRLMRMRGYLGDLEREWVVRPPTGLETERYSNASVYAGLLEITKSCNGAYHVRSAKEITFEKYLLIPVPKELIAPEDPLGDHSGNYKAANVYGNGEAYELPEYTWGDDDPSLKAAQLWEYHAYLFGKYTTAPVVAHVKDWLFPEEQQLELGAPAIYSKSLKFGHRFSAELPAFGDLVIDQRQNSVRYYRSRSVIKQLDDGGVLIEDGWGSQLLLSGGNIQQTAPGDVWMRPGRSVVAWAPRDVVLRAGNAADITASKGDVRLKAERNLHMLSGNSGTGGTLIENRSESKARPADFAQLGAGVNGHGVVIKSTKSSFYAFADDIHVGRDQTGTGRVTIDAGNQGTLYLRGQNIFNYNLGVFSVFRDVELGGDPQVFVIDQNTAVITVPTQIGGSVVIAPAGNQTSAHLLVGGRVVAYEEGFFGKTVATNGIFASAGSDSGMVGSLKEEIDLSAVEPAVLANNIKKQRDVVKTIVDSIDAVVVEDADSSPGNERFQARMGFSCRTTDDIKLDGTFLIYESRWQQMMRVAGETTTWDEPQVSAPDGQITLPHPGQKAWEELEAYGQINFDNFNYVNGVSNPRSSLKAEGQAPVKGSLKTGYLINVQ